MKPLCPAGKEKIRKGFVQCGGAIHSDFLHLPDLLIFKISIKNQAHRCLLQILRFSTFGKEKTSKSDDFKVFLHSLELLVEISGIEPLTS